MYEQCSMTAKLPPLRIPKDKRYRRKKNLLIFSVKQSSQNLNKANKQVEAILSKISIEPSVIAYSSRIRQNDASKPVFFFYTSLRG